MKNHDTLQDNISYEVTKTISVWMTCCDKAQYLEEAIDSILNQTLQPLEILISNDCSTDDTKEILDKYAQKYPELITVFHQPTRLGITKNKNFILSKCKGEYITWLDGDDRFYPQKLEKELGALNRFPKAKIVFSNTNQIDMNGKFVKVQTDSHTVNVHFKMSNTTDMLPINLCSHILMVSDLIAHQRNELIHRDVLEEIGLFDENVILWQDYDYRVRQYQKFDCVYVPIHLQDYRIYKDQTSASHPIQSTKDLRYLYSKFDIKSQSKQIQRNWRGRM